MSFRWIMFLSFIAVMTAFGQGTPRAAISGNVVDASTNKPLPYAIVFLAGTTLGTPTDSAGRFEIKNIPLGSHELVVSMVGYKRRSYSLQLFEPAQKTVNVQLQPSEVQTQAVEVVASDPKEWRKNLEQFQKEFFGETKNATECQILNKESLNFQVDEKKRIFIATAPVPLEIENRALGLKIRLWLEEFKMEGSILQYRGNTQFEYLQPSTPRESEGWRSSRKKAYFGSRRHFLTAVAQGRANAEGFEVYQVMNIRSANIGTEVGRMPVDVATFVNRTEYDFQKRLRFSDYLQIVYQREIPEPAFEILMSLDNLNYRQQVSWITMNRSPVYFTVDGNTLEPYALKVFGYWAFERVAELLPLDYDPNEDRK